jgi:predicted nucleotidyltransferase
MARHPERPEEIFEPFVTEFRGVFERDLVSIALYGSAAGGDYRPGRSDLNFLIVLTEAGIEELDRAFDAVERWRKRRVAVPLFVTEAYIRGSQDVFPLEYLDMKRRHVHVYGRDILGKLSFEREHVRLQCEREIKGKLLLLREGFLETGGRKRALKALVAESLPSFVAVFGGLLFLEGKEIPAAKGDVLRAGCETFSLDASLFEELLGVREERLKPDEGRLLEMLKLYLKEIRKLALLADSWGG